MNTLFWKILVTRVKRKIELPLSPSIGPGSWLTPGSRLTSGQDDRETWAAVADLHEHLAGTIRADLTEAAHALDIRRLQHRKYLVTASFEDRLLGSRHSKRTVSSIDSVATEIDEVATGERAAARCKRPPVARLSTYVYVDMNFLGEPAGEENE